MICAMLANAFAGLRRLGFRRLTRHRGFARAELLSSSALAASQDGPVEDDGWGFGSPDPAADNASSTLTATASQPEPEPDGDADDSGWGLDEDTTAIEPTPSDPPAEADADASDGWDIDDEFSTPAPEPAPAPAAAATEVLEAAAPHADDDGWGFEPATPTVPATPDRDAWGFESNPGSPTPSVTAVKAPIVSTKRGLGRPVKPMTAVEDAPVAEQEEEPAAAWAAWEQEDDEEDADEAARSLKPAHGLFAQSVVEPVERLSISAKSKDVVDLAEALLEDARRADQSDVSAVFQTAAPHLVQSFTALLDLYRAVLPVQHASLVSTVPALGMQFANDCDWIAAAIADRTAGGDEEAVAWTTAELRACALRVRTQQMTAQRAAIDECLDEAARFRNVSDEARYAACERAVKQVGYTLERLAHVWKGVLTPRAFDAALGALVNGVFARVLDEIGGQDDISEDESKRLNVLCRELHALQTLFPGGGDGGAIGDHAPLWFKFVYLSELLEASMADVQYLYGENMLRDFSADELIRLVRALFADSANRAKFLERIRTTHMQA